MIFSILVTLHIITAAAWFGLGLRLAGRARTVLDQGGEAGIALANDGASTVWQMNIFAVLTLVFSLGAFVAGGHFVAYGPLYHTSVTLIVLFAADQLFVIRPGWNTLQAFVTGAGARRSGPTRPMRRGRRWPSGPGWGTCSGSSCSSSCSGIGTWACTSLSRRAVRARPTHSVRPVRREGHGAPFVLVRAAVAQKQPAGGGVGGPGKIE
jgi:hypothetical protein